MQTIAVVGSRTYPVPKSLWETLSDVKREEQNLRGRSMVRSHLEHIRDPIVVVSGGAKGPDSWAAEWAREKDWRVVEIRPNWKKYGKGAGFHRNTEIAEAADEVIAFWDGESKGTFDTMKKAADMEKPLLVIGPYGDPVFALTQENYQLLRAANVPPAMDIPKGR